MPRIGTAKYLTTALPSNVVRRLGNMMDGIEKAGVYGIMGKEVVGINAPKMLRIRNGNEFVDSAVSELGNTAGYFGIGALLTLGMGKLFPKMAGKEMYNIGQSILLCCVPGSVLYAMPFIRNYVSAKRTGTTGFTELVGHTSFVKQSKADYDKDVRYFKNTALSVLGVGAALGFGGLAYCKRLANKGVVKAHNAFTKFWRNTFMFKGGKFKNMGDNVGLWFWGLPAYAGWIHASRQKEERNEQVVKMLNFFAMFYFLPKAVQAWLKSPKNYDKHFIKHLKNNKVDFNDKKAVIALMDKLKYSKVKQAKFLKTRGVHKAIAYLASVGGLFVSNWIANSVAIDITAGIARRQQKKYGKLFVDKFNNRPNGWQSPTFPAFSAQVNGATLPTTQ